MSEIRGLQVTSSPAAKERRLATLLAGRDPATLGLPAVVEDAQVAGSLELAGVPTTLAEARAARTGESRHPARRLHDALGAVAAGAPFTVAALGRWHAAVVGGPSHYRTDARADGAPPAFIESRLAILEQWLAAESRRQLKPAQAGALVLARLLEIAPFDEGNGRVARLAASHLMVQGGASPPILVGGDAPRLTEAVEAAFQLATAPLSALLDEASGRVLDVMIKALE